MAPNFRSLLSKPVESAKRPPVLPPGTYYGLIAEYKFDESKQPNKNTGQKTPMLVATIKNIQPGEDVDTSLLVDEEKQPIDMAKKVFYHNFILSDTAIFRLREFMEAAGMNIAGRSFEELIPELKGQPVVLAVIQRPTEDGQNLRNELADLKPQPRQ